MRRSPSLSWRSKEEGEGEAPPARPLTPLDSRTACESRDGQGGDLGGRETEAAQCSEEEEGSFECQCGCDTSDGHLQFFSLRC